MQEEPGARREQCPRDRPQHGDGPPGDGPLPSPVVGRHQRKQRNVCWEAKMIRI